jgi:probable rRNA maturation factor
MTSRRRRLKVTVVAPTPLGSSTRGLARWLERAAPARVSGQVTVAVITDRAMRVLNRQFRGVDAPTDVLSFPAGPGAVHSRAGTRRDKSSEINHLGDIALAAGVARRQALAYHHALGTELRLLALHGLLHLIGYDHERDQGQMLRLEARLRRRMNLPDGLLTRASGRRQR